MSQSMAAVYRRGREISIRNYYHTSITPDRGNTNNNHHWHTAPASAPLRSWESSDPHRVRSRTIALSSTDDDNDLPRGRIRRLLRPDAGDHDRSADRVFSSRRPSARIEEGVVRRWTGRGFAMSRGISCVRALHQGHTRGTPDLPAAYVRARRVAQVNALILRLCAGERGGTRPQPPSARIGAVWESRRPLGGGRACRDTLAPGSTCVEPAHTAAPGVQMSRDSSDRTGAGSIERAGSAGEATCVVMQLHFARGATVARVPADTEIQDGRGISVDALDMCESIVIDRLSKRTRRNVL